MKGIIFTEFTEMVEKQFGLEMLDQIIESSNLPSKGIYTTVGTYSHEEMASLLGNFCSLSKLSVPDALKHFGNYLFHSFANLYPDFINNEQHIFRFLESIEHHIHVEVLKLYPDAKLPSFNCKQVDEKTLIMEYSSDNHLEWLAVGLIEGALTQFKTQGDVTLLDPTDESQVKLIQIRLK